MVGCPSCHPTSSVTALKATDDLTQWSGLILSISTTGLPRQGALVATPAVRCRCLNFSNTFLGLHVNVSSCSLITFVDFNTINRTVILSLIRFSLWTAFFLCQRITQLAASCRVAMSHNFSLFDRLSFVSYKLGT